MLLSNWLLAALLIAGASVFLMRRRIRVTSRGPRFAPPMERATTERVPKAEAGMCTHAVSVVPDLMGCAAVRGIENRRFLSAEAPPLPLAGCDVERCTCHYRHHADRRSEEDRRLQIGAFGGFGAMMPEDDRRDKKDRRKSV